MKQKRRIISLVMASLLMFSMTATALPPLEMTDMTEALYRSNVITPILSASLSHSFEDAVIANESTWIPLHDTEGTEYAYFVPLCNEKGMIAGYSVIGNIDGNHTTLCNSYGGILDEFVVMIVEAYQSRNVGDKLIYSFPYAFIIGQEGSYKRIYENGDVEAVEDIAKYDSHVTDMLREKASVYNSDVSTQAVTTYAELDHWADRQFVPIEDDVDPTREGYIYYGGWQNWLEDEGVSEFFADKACGLTAAANAFCYMSDNVSGKAALYTPTNTFRSSFSNYQKALYDVGFAPGVDGISSLIEMRDNVLTWANLVNVSLTCNSSSNGWTYSQFLSHICAGLRNESPVLLMTWDSPVGGLENHWVTITRMHDPGDNSGLRMTVSNWHNKKEYNFDAWYQGGSTRRATIYFE